MTQTIPGGASRSGVGDAPVALGPISGGHLVAQALKAEGVDTIRTLCGSHIIDVHDGCVDQGIAVIDVRHEQVAAHAADGYAGITGRPGAAAVTAGPGTGDAITGMANAFRAEFRTEDSIYIGDGGDIVGGDGGEITDPADIAPALQRARESGVPSLINVWVDPEIYAPGTMNQTMYK
jgi:thiamine pyrophosphate-dependent acetolactate synthase large subunit-like protein